MLKQAIQFGHSPAICRQFVITKYSPDEEIVKAVQSDFDNQCRWFKEAEETLLASKEYINNKYIDIETFGKLSDSKFDNFAKENFISALNNYNNHVKYIESMQLQKQPNGLELFIAYIAPVLLTIALALRFIKVTLEIRLEK